MSDDVRFDRPGPPHEPLDALLAREIAAAGQTPDFDPELPAVDLRTLLGEMAALKSEVRAETRAAREMRDALRGEAAGLRADLDRAAAREADLRDRLDQAARDSRRHAARALFDIADRLEAAVRSARTPVRRQWFRPTDSALPALVDGLELTLRRVHEHLGELSVRRIEIRDCTFDPQYMQAVRAVCRPDIDDGVLVEEITAGYRDDDSVLRAAEVIVNQRQETS